MHMCYPLLPRHPPTPSLQQLSSHQDDAFRGLSHMMHSGLSHFVGRNLPTIWSFLNTNEAEAITLVRTPFTDHDLQMIRLWARQLDDWLVRFSGASRKGSLALHMHCSCFSCVSVLEPSPSDRHGILVLLQYHLHKLYVLSIYHPARGFDLSSTDISTFERQELLASARAVLRLRQNDSAIWSNWDLIVRKNHDNSSSHGGI